MFDYETYKPLIKRIANKYSIGHPTNREELFSAACCGVCELRFEESDTEETVKMKIIQKCRESCRTFIAADRVISMHKGTYYKKLSENDLPNRATLDESIVAKQDDEHLVRMLVEDLPFTPRERIVVQLSLAGYEFEEIAKMIGVKLNRLRQIRHIIKEKILCSLRDS